MKPLPRDPMGLHERAIAALIDDIWDTRSKGFERVDALRGVLKARAK